MRWCEKGLETRAKKFIYKFDKANTVNEARQASRFPIGNFFPLLCTGEASNDVASQ